MDTPLVVELNCYAEYRFALEGQLTTADAFGADDLMQCNSRP